jgi:diketogulonate reductase-like aldo/keto reductase
MAKLPELKLNTGKMIPVLGFGTWALAEGEEALTAVGEALKIGYRLIDTAKLYGNERSIGQAIRKSRILRKEIFVTTKLWTSDQGYQSALDAFDESLARLALDYVDLYLIHWPGAGRQAYKDSWRALSEIHQRGDAKAVGVSNFSVEQLQDIMDDSRLAPAVNQIEFHPFIYRNQAEIVEFCRQNGIVVEAYSPLSHGRHIEHKQISDIAQRVGKTNAQVMLRWTIQHNTVPIPKSSHAARMKENIDVFDFELSDEDMSRLDNLGAQRFGFF